MSIAQPEYGLPQRRVITADSFRALKLKLNGSGSAAATALLPALTPLAITPPDLEPPIPALETIEPPADLETGTGSPIEISASDDTPAADAGFAGTVPDVIAMPLAAESDHMFPAEPAAPVPVKPPEFGFRERHVLEKPQQEDPAAGERALALLDIMVVPAGGSLPQERALANDTLLRLIPRMPLRSLRHLAERVCLMEAPSEMLVRRLINDPRIEVSGPLLENAMAIHDSNLIAVANLKNPAKLRLIARRRIVSPALAEALIQSNHVDTLLNLVRNEGASFSIESMWRLTHFANAHPALQAPLVTRRDTPSLIAFQLFWRLPSELRRYVLSRFLTDSETISRILSMNMEGEGTRPRFANPSLLSRLAKAEPREAGGILARLAHVSEVTGARIADDAGGEALTVALKAAGLTRAQFAGVVARRADAEDLRSMFEALSFNKARVLLTYWDWAARRTGPYSRPAA